MKPFGLSPETKRLEDLCQGLAIEIDRVLPKETGALLLLAEREGNAARVSCASCIEDELALVALYDWIESKGIVVELAPTVARAIDLLKRTEGRGIQGSMTPAGALAMGVMAGLLAAPGAENVAMPDVAAQAILLLEAMLRAKPIADAELRAEAAAAASGRQA